MISSKHTVGTISSHGSSTYNGCQVYIPDIPMDMLENDLVQLIRTRLMVNIQQMETKDIKCYIKLGVAVIRLTSEKDKETLVSNIGSIVLDTKRKINVSFTNDVESDSYIVFDRKTHMIPSDDQIARQYAQTCKLPGIPLCHKVSVDFANVFHIVFNTFDELLLATEVTDFKMGNACPIVYLRSHCSFFQGFPPNTTEAKIVSAISNQFNEKELSSTSFYVQLNETTGHAIVLAPQTNKKWMETNAITIDGRSLPKKMTLTYSVLVRSVVTDIEREEILNLPIFKERVSNYIYSNSRLILEFDDTDKNKMVREVNSIEIGNGKKFSVIPYSTVLDRDEGKFDAQNWYENEMFAVFEAKSDITTLIDNVTHPIFHYNWNADMWLGQMKKVNFKDQRSKKHDLVRHLLRMTVMLNTIGILKKKTYTINDREIVLQCKTLKTISYNHKSKLLCRTTVDPAFIKPLFPGTNVVVVNEDCLVLYEKLVARNLRPLLLNMANATNPGGGYRKGDGAQEETLFRRSNYYHSLDEELADKELSERYHQAETCDMEKMTGHAKLYPMDEFGAIYTAGISVFRETESDGYKYMENPLYDVCAIAMAAYRNPTLTKDNMLEKKFAMNTRKKIENIFAIAHYHKHDCLVLSAFGCGAFKNPPGHIALLFKSVIYQYAGYFKTVYFAIVDDHNTGNDINPNGNIAPFEKLLNDLTIKPPETIPVGGMSGPYRVVDKTSDGKLILSDVCIQGLLPCQYGSKCHELKKSDHNMNFSHPPVCCYQDTTSSCDQMNDEIHALTFMHLLKCKYGGLCNSEDPQHFNNFEHPNYCEQGGRCQDVRQDHLTKFRHLPACQKGLECLEYLKGDHNHCAAFRHCKSMCSYDNCCVLFHDRKHFENSIHSFRPPCPFTPYNCSKYVEFIQQTNKGTLSVETENHVWKYSHVCPFGRQCQIKEGKHFETSIHIGRQLCVKGENCTKLGDEEHLESFSHSDIRDIRLFCREPGFICKGRNVDEHLRKYRHGKNYDTLSAVQSSNFNESVNFVRNQSQLIKVVNNYVNSSRWQKAPLSRDILSWIKALQPVHRCAPHIFESILVHGHVMSRYYMELLKQPKYVVEAVRHHSRIRLIFIKHNIPSTKEHAVRLIKAVVEEEFGACASTGAHPTYHGHDNDIRVLQQKLKPPLSDQDINAIIEWAKKIARASIKLHENPMGIGYDVDRSLGTDKHVFSILGPHLGHYYGDIVIIFKKEIMLHPDSNFSIQAGTSFGPSKHAYQYRPWLTDPGDSTKRFAQFHESKLHCSVPYYENAAATELIALTGQNNRSMNVTLQDVIHRWMSVDSHQVFEAHLPQLIPLDYIDRVFIPKNLFNTLTSEAQRSARAAFRDALTLTDHEIDLNLMKPSFGLKPDITRQPYQNFVVQQTLESIEIRRRKEHANYGIIVTIPASRFEKHIILPQALSHSFKLFCLDKTPPPTMLESTYIYWQVMNGDMMLTISNQKINPDKEQHDLNCLICYVAGIPSTTTEDYHESYSYLNNGKPYEHEMNCHTNKYKAKSNVFYRGCNIDDFLTFCLSINHRNGHVSLSHAGPNSIYNHEKIEYKFDKNQLDLATIDYIYVSAGNQDVPVRNLTIAHERIPRLHPTFDKDFKIDTSALQNKMISNVPYADGTHPLAINDHLADDVKKKNVAVVPHMTRGNRSTERKLPNKSTSILTKIINALACRSKASAAAISNSSDSEESLSSSTKLTTQPLKTSSKLPPCKYSVYCVDRESKAHFEKYSHPCRFNELCRKKDSEPHFVHEEHHVPKCSDDMNCSKRTDPIHRSQFRHTNLPDYLVPCRYQESCYDRSPEHRIKYFHGEELPSIKKNRLPTRVAAKGLIPCRYGNDCRMKYHPDHRSKYSHPSS